MEGQNINKSNALVTIWKIFTDNVDIGLNPSSIILDLKKGAIGSTFLNKLNPCDHFVIEA
jgi:hypothetical protein